jgi:hypothetical protein
VPDEDDPAALIDANLALEGRQPDSRWAAADHGVVRQVRDAARVHPRDRLIS